MCVCVCVCVTMRMQVCSGVFDMAHLWTVPHLLNYAVHILLSACLKNNGMKK